MPISMTNLGMAGLSTKFGNAAGIGVITRPTAGTGSVPNAGTGVTPTLSGTDTPSPVTVLIGMIILLVLLKFIGEHDKTAIKPAHISIGGYNLLAVTITAMIGITLMKLVFIRWNVPGVSPLVKFV